jgi:chromosome condensin MukBEF MukE localization factor
MDSTAINHPERLAVTIAYKHFPFLKKVWENDKTVGEDINQIGFLCFYESDKSFKDFYNRVQRELYYLAKIFGFRRTHKNEWIKKEESENSSQPSPTLN